MGCACGGSSGTEGYRCRILGSDRWLNHRSAELKEILAGLEALDYRRTYQQFYDFRPYPRQKENFLDAGSAFSERLLIAGNQNGKTHVGAFEVACHMTGIYPDDWKGRRFAKADRAAGSPAQTSLVVRDVQQKRSFAASRASRLTALPAPA